MPRPVASSLPALLLALWLAAAAAAAAAPDAAQRTRYTTRFDHIDLERILSSRRLVANYVDCLLGRKRCPPEGAELKRVLPDALATRCARCSERQRDAAVRAIRLLRQRYPELWAPLQAKWDPSGEHTRRLEQATARRASTPRAAPTGSAPVAARAESVKSASVSAPHTALAATSASNIAAAAVDKRRGRLQQASAPRASKPRTSTVVPAAGESATAAGTDSLYLADATPIIYVTSTASPASAVRTDSVILSTNNTYLTPVAASLTSAARTNSVGPAPAAVSHTVPDRPVAANTAAAHKRGRFELAAVRRAITPRTLPAAPAALPTPGSGGGSATAAGTDSVNLADATHNTYVTPTASPASAVNLGFPSLAPASLTIPDSPIAESASNTASATDKPRSRSIVPVTPSAWLTAHGSVPATTWTPAVSTAKISATARPIPVVLTATSTKIDPQVSPTTAAPAEAGSIPAAKINSVIPAAVSS
ncbi:hypothetical protein R5R35_003326 [Gryllus longicercus]|uniref:Chemosensory protein n=1 Tax=Gryllus longicercus TaxID=2509291 RepID=A0AAN9VJP4_9ORTH